MSATIGSFGTADMSASSLSVRGLDGVNLFLAAALAGFGPYVAAYLADQKWTQTDIGLVLTVGSVAGLLSQLPGGEMLDHVRSKRAVIAVGASVVILSALILAFWPRLPSVFIALVLQGATGGFLGPAIAAISLGLVGHAALAERLGRNQRFASAGALAGAALMGLVGYLVSYKAIFLIVALLGLPLFFALVRIRVTDIHFGRSCGAPDHQGIEQPPKVDRRILLGDSRLVIFATSLFLFQLANASVLPLVSEALVRVSETDSSLVISALIIVPQIIVTLMAPGVGRQAQDWGRRPLLLIGFAALPIRALCFALISDPFAFLAVQALDGISATVLGVLTALVIADLTGGTGRFNLAQGFVGTASGIGASISTTLSGLVAAGLGASVAFLCIAAIASLGTLMIWFLMPETKPPTPAGTRGQSVANAHIERKQFSNGAQHDVQSSSRPTADLNPSGPDNTD
jgi:MFS family permease